MDEVYTCICGNQKWSIHEQFIRCTKCKAEYKVELESPMIFNADRIVDAQSMGERKR